MVVPMPADVDVLLETVVPVHHLLGDPAGDGERDFAVALASGSGFQFCDPLFQISAAVMARQAALNIGFLWHPEPLLTPNLTPSGSGWWDRSVQNSVDVTPGDTEFMSNVGKVHGLGPLRHGHGCGRCVAFPPCRRPSALHWLSPRLDVRGVGWSRTRRTLPACRRRPYPPLKLCRWAAPSLSGQPLSGAVHGRGFEDRAWNGQGGRCG